MLTKMVVYLVPVDLHARSTISLADFDIAKPRDPPTERGGACAPAFGRGISGLRYVKVRERYRRPGMKVDRDEIYDHLRQH